RRIAAFRIFRKYLLRTSHGVRWFWYKRWVDFQRTTSSRVVSDVSDIQHRRLKSVKIIAPLDNHYIPALERDMNRQLVINFVNGRNEARNGLSACGFQDGDSGRSALLRATCGFFGHRREKTGTPARA